MKNEQPSQEQLTALLAFARREGRYWKESLRDAWMTGIYPRHAQDGYLQQVRNEFGPSWLIKFKLPTGGAAMTDKQKRRSLQTRKYGEAVKAHNRAVEALDELMTALEMIHELRVDDDNAYWVTGGVPRVVIDRAYMVLKGETK